MKLGSLFSGIGGIELGFERTGRFKMIWNCEIEPYPSAVLAERFPGVVNYGDITKVDWTRVERPDVLVGGFPCQDISVAGKGKGIKEGTRSGLWSEYARAIRELRPRYVVVENVAMLARRGLTRVLGDLAALGYDAEWFTLRASDIGAPHRRERLFIIAHADSSGCGAGCDNREGRPILSTQKRGVAEESAKRDRRLARPVEDADAPDTDREHEPRRQRAHRFPEFTWCENIREVKELFNRPDIPEPLVRGTNDGLPRGLDGFIRKERTKCLGNAVVPAVAEIVAWRVLAMEGGKR